ncbi:MAG: hypothetical protein WDM81_08045 [Rhizomicrobium sp.]
MSMTWTSSAAAGSGISAVTIGTAPPQPIAMPSNPARPTDSPTRCPAPISASENDMS